MHNPPASVNSDTAVSFVYLEVQSESVIYLGHYGKEHWACVLGTGLSYLSPCLIYLSNKYKKEWLMHDTCRNPHICVSVCLCAHTHVHEYNFRVLWVEKGTIR